MNKKITASLMSLLMIAMAMPAMAVDVPANIEIQDCPVGMISVSTDEQVVSFPNVYVGETSTSTTFVLAVGAEGYLPEEAGDCQAMPTEVQVDFSVGTWDNSDGTMTTTVVGGNVQVLPVGGNSVGLNLELLDVPAGTYSQTITITATY